MDGWRRGVPIHSHMTLLIPQVGSVSGSLLHTTRAEPRGPRDDGVLLRLCARLLPAAPGGTERRNEKNRHTDILIRINKKLNIIHSFSSRVTSSACGVLTLSTPERTEKAHRWRINFTPEQNKKMRHSDSPGNYFHRSSFPAPLQSDLSKTLVRSYQRSYTYAYSLHVYT